ncbi:glutamate 5-kinase [Maricaulis sp. W15]|uniref:glutamate 5-kinase n=1 Tax=Maricaulis sp. W15 TaxID=1772333 RepID=UPI000948C07D|nr:glutamate 5-kinase [Maricaulis sp. W15]OLF75273.1 glutamate 5-kinase [Maricaulis sp. W15]
MTRTGFDAAHCVVVKAGSSLLQAGDAVIAAIADDIVALRARGARVTIVSSGAVALGRDRLGLPSGSLSLEQKQAAAAAGQPRLLDLWDRAFAPHGAVTAQALLTLDVTENRRSWLNARATLGTLLELGAIPIVNENDTIATDEIRYGDNDRLAARVAQLTGADLLVLLSDVAALHDADPRTVTAARPLHDIPVIDAAIHAMAGDANTAAGVGTGGMRTKILAAELAGSSGCATAIALGTAPNPVLSLARADHGSWFHPARNSANARERWISGVVSRSGAVRIDAGATHALLAGKSLLPVGVRSVDGQFERGETIRILDPDGRLVARGVSAYCADDARRVAGCRSDEAEARLGYRRAAALVHADDIVCVVAPGLDA